MILCMFQANCFRACILYARDSRTSLGVTSSDYGRHERRVASKMQKRARWKIMQIWGKQFFFYQKPSKKSYIVWDTTPCSLSKVNPTFQSNMSSPSLGSKHTPSQLVLLWEPPILQNQNRLMFSWGLTSFPVRNFASHVHIRCYNNLNSQKT